MSSLIAIAFIGMYVGLQRDPAPHGIPIAVVGSELGTSLQRALGDVVGVREVSDVAEGRELVDGRDVVAVVSQVPDHRASPRVPLTLEVAGANGPSTVGALERMIRGYARSTGTQVAVEDRVPLVRYDSRGTVGFYVAFGVTLASFVLAQMLMAMTAQLHLRHRLIAVIGFAALVGVLASVLAGPVMGALPGDFTGMAVTLALLSAATALATKALGAWLGAVGIPIATILLITIGNSTSGATVGVDLLPGYARVLSELLPPGAAIRSITDVSYFDGAHQWSGWLVLIAWIVVAAALTTLRARRPTTSTTRERAIKS
ncbi:MULTISPECIES: ABC transporter permease [Gordonia]|uniref:ABC transporter permease n=1 Tax=Gordonia TaxID=2053 RepID=UPI001EF5CF63|nr:ABC transporter permease [Gordonia sp. McavH-238-E]MCG7631430.1 ABC transporter permease [Gordonia sp. McavH-238-E]